MIQKKVCMLGAFAVGKTSLVARFVSSIYSDAYHTTVGVKIDKKELTIAGTQVNLVLWDMQGEDELQKVKLVYLRGAAGYLLVADGTRRATLEVAQALKRKVDQTLGQIPFVLVINKADRTDDWEIDSGPGRGELDALVGQGWTVVKTSARTGFGVEEAFLRMAELVLRAPHG
jgi:small GTP-binding protein